MERWKIEYFRLTYLAKDVTFTDSEVEKEANNWLSAMPDTFDTPMAKMFKLGWDAHEEYSESLVDRIPD